jgi:ABC-type nickel/cobalt efflux system permease component RcnA
LTLPAISFCALTAKPINTLENDVHEMDEDGSVLAGFVHTDLTPKMFIIAFITAVSLGAVHALSPGHGKAMVASNGKVKDAVFLGGVATITHVISVMVVGIVTLIFTEHVVQEKLNGWLGFASGLLIFIIG